MRLSPRQRKLLTTVHIATAVGILGADLSLLALGVAGLNADDPGTAYPAAHLIARWVVAPLTVPTVVTGTLLAFGAGFHPRRHRWVAIKMATTFVLIAALFGVLVPGLARTAEFTLSQPAGALTTAEAVPFVIAPAAAVIVLTINVLLAVTRPGGRNRELAGVAVRPQ